MMLRRPTSAGPVLAQHPEQAALHGQRELWHTHGVRHGVNDGQAVLDFQLHPFIQPFIHPFVSDQLRRLTKVRILVIHLENGPSEGVLSVHSRAVTWPQPTSRLATANLEPLPPEEVLQRNLMARPRATPRATPPEPKKQ